MADPASLQPADGLSGKEPGAFRTIGEVAAALGIRQHVLRYWEEQFPMLRPVKRSGGRRYYRPADVALIETIDRLVHREGFTLRGARQHLAKRAAPAATPPVEVSPAAPAVLPAAAPAAPRVDPAMLARLRAIRADLAAALGA